MIYLNKLLYILKAFIGMSFQKLQCKAKRPNVYLFTTFGRLVFFTQFAISSPPSQAFAWSATSKDYFKIFSFTFYGCSFLLLGRLVEDHARLARVVAIGAHES
jgi:hypothetical protein